MENDGPGSLDDLGCIAMVERDGAIVARNALARRITGYSGTPTDDPESSRIGSALPGAYLLKEDDARMRFDCLLQRRHGAPLAVHAVVQTTIYRGAESRLILLLERCDAFGETGEGGGSLVEDVLNAMPEAAVMTHAGRVLHVNEEFTRLFDYPTRECVGRVLGELVVPDNLLHERELVQHTLLTEARASLDTQRRTRNGELIEVSVRVAKVRLGGRATGALVTYRDLRQEKRDAAQLKHRARHDVLTGLPNRAAFLERVSLTLARLHRRPDRGFAIIFMDLDGFKKVNDTLGHAAGDKLLLIVADRLTKCLRPQDAVARFGGDEFALLLDESGTEADVQAVAERIQTAMVQPMAIDGAAAKVSASMGILIAEARYESAEEMLKHADAAMYRAKTAGGGRHVSHADADGEAV